MTAHINLESAALILGWIALTTFVFWFAAQSVLVGRGGR